jgi:hypothetical protein
MSSNPAQAASDPAQGGPGAEAGEERGRPSEEELQAAYEAEISRVSSTDMILQAVVSLLNIGGHRLGLTPQGGAKAGEAAGEAARDLEQVRDAIDGARALMPILERREPENLRPLRDALAQLQMAYAREAGVGAPPNRATAAAKPEQAPAAEQKPTGPGPAQSSGRLWVPGR